MKYLCMISFDEKKMDALSKQGRTRSADRYSQATAKDCSYPRLPRMPPACDQLTADNPLDNIGGRLHTRPRRIQPACQPDIPGRLDQLLANPGPFFLVKKQIAH
jgi:hypothetical protein